MKYPPIHAYGLIGDCRTAALVSQGGSIDWLCWPRFDSPALFANLLDGDTGGYWQVAPVTAREVERRYLEDTNVLSTRWRTDTGTLECIEFMPVGNIVGLLPEHAIIRLYVCHEGEVELGGSLVARGDYGARKISWKAEGHFHRAHFNNFQYTLQSFGCRYELAGAGVQTHLRLRAGERAAMVLAANRDGPAVLFTEVHLWRMLDATVAEWQTWAAACTYRGPYREEVVRSALALKAMNFAPSGALVAAPTASLPEIPGGGLNWDYRYCWLRDASHTTRALWELGYDDEANAFVGWLLHATVLSRPRLRVLYDVFGRRPPPEYDAAWLQGYAGSRPVRIGNAAESQHQLDVYGEVIDAAFQRILQNRHADGETAGLLLDMATYACQHWREMDAGIWEYRDELRHHTHSKLLCWVAADRIVRLQALGLVPESRVNFGAVRESIASYIFSQAQASGNLLTAAAGDPEIDASVLLAAAFGFFAPGDPIMARTYQQVQARLGAGPGLLYRAERFVGHEGAFLFCSFWAVEYLALGGGSLAAAERAFNDVLAYRNELGLYSEEVEPQSGAALGNFPQAFSHVGLINAALAIEERRAQERHRALGFTATGRRA